MWYAGFEKSCCDTLFDYQFDLSVWYPTRYHESVIHYTEYYDGSVAQNVPTANGLFPLIAFSPGYTGTHYDQAYLAENLARAGFIVVGFSRQYFEKQGGIKGFGFKRAWYRAYEMKLAIKYAIENWRSHWNSRAGIGLFGFSAGGVTSLLLAGANPQFQREPRFPVTLSDLRDFNFSDLVDTRVRALILLAPVLSEIFDANLLAEVTQPTLVITLEKDEIIKDTAEKYIEYLPSIKEHYCMPNGGHYVFNGPVNAFSKKLFPDLMKNSMDRESYHPFIMEKVVHFFKKQLISTELIGESYVS